MKWVKSSVFLFIVSFCILFIAAVEYNKKYPAMKCINGRQHERITSMFEYYADSPVLYSRYKKYPHCDGAEDCIELKKENK